MRTASAAFVAAQGSAETTPATVVTFAWGPNVMSGPTNFSKAFESITPEADLTTDMPAGTREITGYPARGCEMILAGTFNDDPTQTAEWLFDPYSSTSPLFGLDWTGTVGGTVVTVEQGLWLPGLTSPEVYPIFTGYIQNCQINRTTGEVTLTLIDTRATVTEVSGNETFSLGIVGMTAKLSSFISPGLTAMQPIDQLLRVNGILTSPNPRGTLWYMSGHGTLWPQIGQNTTTALFGFGFQAYGSLTTDGTGSFPPTWTQGMWGCGQVPTAGVVTSAVITPGTDLLPFHNTTNNSIYFEGSLKTDLTGANASIFTGTLQAVNGHDAFTFTLGQDAAGHLIFEGGGIKRNNTNKTYTAGYVSTAAAGWHQIGVQLIFTSTTAATINVWLDPGGAQTPISVTAISTYSHDVGLVTLNSSVPFETWHVTSELTPGGPVAFTPTAFLDPSLNTLMAIPAYSGTDPWALLQQLFEAEFGVGGFDEGTTFYFKNRYNRPTVSSLTLSSAGSNKDLQFETNEANRAQTVICTAHPVGVVGPQQIYSQSATVTLPPNSQTVLTFPLSISVQEVVGEFISIPSGGLGGATVNGYLANRNADGSGRNVTNLTGFANSVNATQLQMVLINPNSYTVYLAPTTGFPTQYGVLVVFGNVVSDASVGGAGVTITATYGSGAPSLTLPDNIWRQDIPTCQQLVNDELTDLVRPRPMITNLVVLGDARLQMGDRVTIVDSGDLATGGATRAGAMLNDDFIVTSIHPTIDTTGYTMALVARAVNVPGGWLLGVPGRSELGVTTVI